MGGSQWELLSEGEKDSEGLREVMRLYGGKIGRANAQLELNLIPAVKDYLKHSLATKGGAKENPHRLLVEERENIVTKNEEKADILNAFFATYYYKQDHLFSGHPVPLVRRQVQVAK